MEDMQSLKFRLDTEYIERKKEYDEQVESLRLKREKFYLDNPDFPFKSMYMNVVAPPIRICINIISDTHNS